MYFIDDREIEAIRRVFNKKKLFRYQLGGAGECDLFEQEFAERIGVPYSLMVTSGTNALVAALTACGVGPGDEVIIPTYTFVATATAVTNVGAIPVIVNIDETLGISPLEVEKAITPRTRAIIPVHMDGLSADMTSLVEIARNHGLFLIEDVAQAIGGSHRGKRLGSIGDFGCYSLNENKNISCGEGGIVTTQRRDFYERLFCIQDASSQFNPVQISCFKTIQPFMGSSMRVSEISGAIMRVQLERLEGILSGLRERKRLFLQILSDYRGANVVLGNCAEGDCASSLHLTFPDPQAAALAGQKLRAERILFAPVTTRPAHASWKWAFLLGDRAAATPARNPYLSPGISSDRKYSYENAKYLQSIDILMRTLKMDIDLHLPLEGTRLTAETVLKVLQGV